MNSPINGLDKDGLPSNFASAARAFRAEHGRAGTYNPYPQPNASTGLPRFKAYGLHEFTSLSLPTRELVLDPILPLKGIAMLYAARGVGKTHVGLGAAYAVATGTAFLKWRAPKPRHVFYVDGEMPSRALQDRLKAIIRGIDAVPPTLDDHLRILPMDAQDLGTSINLAEASSQNSIEEMLSDVELLILDNLSTLVNGGRENDAESWIGMQGWLLHLRRKGMSVIMIHHAGRGENARGTSKREDILDTVIHLKRPVDYQIEEGARFEVHLTKCRGVFGEEASPFEARMEVRDEATYWTVRETKDLQALRISEMTRTGMSVREIAEELGIGKSTVNRIQNSLRESPQANAMVPPVSHRPGA